MQVYQADLTDFLNLAKMLKVKGVSGDILRQEINKDQNVEQTRKQNISTVQGQKTTNFSEVTDNDIEPDETASKYLLTYETNIQNSTKLPPEDLSYHTNDPVVMSSKLYMKRGSKRCAECAGCQRKNDCLECKECRDKQANGGPGSLKMCCRLKKCQALKK